MKASFLPCQAEESGRKYLGSTLELVVCWLITNSWLLGQGLERRVQPWSAPFTNFLAVSAPTVANFKAPRCQPACKILENFNHQLSQAFPWGHLTATSCPTSPRFCPCSYSLDFTAPKVDFKLPHIPVGPLTLWTVIGPIWIPGLWKRLAKETCLEVNIHPPNLKETQTLLDRSPWDT